MTTASWFRRHRRPTTPSTRNSATGKQFPRYAGMFEDRDAQRTSADLLAARDRSTWD